MAGKNEVATATEKRELVAKDFTDGLVVKVMEKEKFGLTFPKDYNYTNEFMAAMLILQDTTDANKKPVLESCSRASIENTLLDMATLGVSMQKKQCYPVAYGGKLQCQVSVYGNTCIARRYGLKNIDAMCIYEGDSFIYHIEDARIVVDKHEQDFLHLNKDKIIGAYAICTMDDGSKYVELMNMDMIKQAWKQGFGYKESGNGTHQKFTDQMAMKTVKNRALKYIIRTYGTQAVSDAYDNFEKTEVDDRVVMDVEHDIAANANSEDFIVDVEVKDAVDNPQIVEPEVIAEIVDDKAPFED